MANAPESASAEPHAFWRAERVACDAALAGEWDALAAQGVASPYQSRAWVTAYLDHAGRKQGLEPGLVALRGAQGELLGLFPLVLRRSLGARVAGFVGDKHANYHLPLLAPRFAASLDATGARDVLNAVAKALAADALRFINQPRAWNGRPNPFAALASWEAAQSAHALSLLPDAQSALDRSLSAHARKILRQKRRKLEGLGALRAFRAETRAEVERLSAVFLELKSARFRELGVADPFAEPGVIEMMMDGAFATADAPAAIEWHGLALGERIIAIFVGAVDGQRYSGMATSFDSDESVAKASPGEQLLTDLILDQGARGRIALDLGVGDARYKTTFCDTLEPLVETAIPYSLAGRAVVWRARALRAAKGYAKAAETRWPGAARAGRALLLKISGGTQAST